MPTTQAGPLPQPHPPSRLQLFARGFVQLAVDTALSHIYRRGEIVQVFKGAFGPLTTPSPLLNALFQISGLPD